MNLDKLSKGGEGERGVGPISELLSDRPPFGPIQRLDAAQLREEQQYTMGTSRRSSSIGAKVLFVTMDLAYGTPRTLEKFRVLELVARMPYQAWENIGYIAVTHTARRPRFARRVFDQVRVNRWEQDNEQWHLFVIEEMLSKAPTRLGWLRRQAIPQVLAFTYFHISWLLYAIRPAWSYRLNADFEDHAEHEYALLVDEHPEWEETPFVSEFADDFGQYSSVAELFRQIGFDERLHKLQSEAMIAAPRYT